MGSRMLPRGPGIGQCPLSVSSQPRMWQPDLRMPEQPEDVRVIMQKLILWDIDHTLIETGGVGSEVFRDAFEQVTGRRIDELADVTGRTEQVIFRETLAMYGIKES